jgi:hypothetical protein
MKYSIDQKLTDSRPDDIQTHGAFVAATMAKIAAAEVSETFERVLRTKGTTNQGFVRMKFTRLCYYYRALPRLAAIVLLLGSTGTVGAAGYIAYSWITPTTKIQKIQRTSEGRKQYTLDSQCGAYRSGKSQQYELARGSTLTDANIFQNTCEYDAISSFADAHYVSDNDHDSFAKKKPGDSVTIYDHTNLFAGSTGNNPIFGLTVGHITALSVASITIELPLYSVETSLSHQPSQYYPDGKPVSRTLQLATDTRAWMDGQKLSLTDLHIGDTVQLITRTRNTVKYYADIHQNALGPQLSFDVAGVIKTNLDPNYVAGLGNPAIVNAVASLNACYGNPDYECVSPSNAAFTPIYVAESDSAKNLRYLRKDAGKLTAYELDGRVTKIDGRTITLQTRGATHQMFSVELPYDAVASYNKTQKLKLQVGDLVHANYSQKSHQNHLVIASGDLQIMALVEQYQPDGTITKY